MRRTTPKQRRLFTPLAEDTLSAESSEIDELIRLRPEAAKWILEESTRPSGESCEARRCHLPT